jgi:hypothetical protein
MRGEFMVLHRLGKLTGGYAKSEKISVFGSAWLAYFSDEGVSNIKHASLTRAQDVDWVRGCGTG